MDEIKYCKDCGKEISKKNKTGYCHKCACKHMSGANNPFYGHHHKQETIEAQKKKLSIHFKEKWKDPEYRKHVIDGVTGNRRSDEFKETQRRNALKQMQDPKQREVRRIALQKAWQDGRIPIKSHPQSSQSKQEKKFFEELRTSLPDVKFDYHTPLHYFDEELKKTRWYLPDCLIEDLKLIIEFNGSYWHADPRRYDAEEEIGRRSCARKAKEIWGIDKKRYDIFKDLGYETLVIWGDDYKKNNIEEIERTKQKIIDYGNNRKI